MTTDTSSVRLGDLLTGAGLLQASDLREAMFIAKQQSLPVGRVLIMSGYLTEGQLQAAVQAQSLLKDGLIDLETVLKALSLVGTEDVSLDDAFKRLDWKQESGAVTNKLGELLLAADIVAQPQLDAAVQQGQQVGLPLGRLLIANGVITEQMLTAALNAQVLIRDKKVTRELAIQGLKSAKDRQIPIEQFLAETGVLALPTTAMIRLGELLVLSGLLDEANLMGAVELGLVNEQLIGQVLRQLGMITEEVLNAALELQQMIFNGKISRADAGKALNFVHNRRLSVADAVEATKPPPPPPPPPPPTPIAPPLSSPPVVQAPPLGDSQSLAALSQPQFEQPPPSTSAQQEPQAQPASADSSSPMSPGSAGSAGSAGPAGPAGHTGAASSTAPPLAAEQPLAAPPSDILPLYQFLQLAGVITPKDIENAIRAGSKDTEIMAQMLVLAGIMEQSLVESAKQCSVLMVRGILTTEQAMIVLKSCQRSRAPLPHAFAELGWDPRPLSIFDQSDEAQIAPAADFDQSHQGQAPIQAHVQAPVQTQAPVQAPTPIAQPEAPEPQPMSAGTTASAASFSAPMPTQSELFASVPASASTDSWAHSMSAPALPPPPPPRPAAGGFDPQRTLDNPPLVTQDESLMPGPEQEAPPDIQDQQIQQIQQDQPDQQDQPSQQDQPGPDEKPKKKLMDFMPKLGQQG